MVDFFGNGLCIHCHLAKNELVDLASFNQLSEASWKEKDDTLQEELSELLEKYPEKSHDDIIDSYSWELHLNQQKYPTLHRESLVITVFNFLEHQLNSLCHIFYESISSNLKLKDIHGQGVERALLFLTKVVNIDLASFGAELPAIKGVNLVRNIIVHNGGVLPSDAHAKVNKFVSEAEHISGSAGRGVNIHAEFIAYFIDILAAFFDKLDKEVQKHIQAYHA
ncbi:hypothetical protein [Alloalcanivorax gelatiniphagus]|uniref:DUF4145 domain-containing protein n=1 Tax=Alloalcanivorax gelatiniphagus TaxID=1194167 RepID=A0ABY2XJD8_9GAMM|nr:hypothetical protein [Alloalcanivorax gelatiniphagus]TMW11224.1 hypothetical protein FGS76_14275 [Alloalcanivorax gelatiniphagus]